MDYEPHVGFVDAHAERDRSHDHVDIIPGERVLLPSPLGLLHAGMVRDRTYALPAEIVYRLLDRLSRQTVYDSALARMTADEGEDLSPGVSLTFLATTNEEIRPEERSLVSAGAAHAELPNDVARDARRGRGR